MTIKNSTKTTPHHHTAKRVAQTGILVALAMVLSYVEVLLSMGINLPGVKLGLCHIVTLYAIYRMRPLDVWLIELVRCVLVAMLFGNAMTFLYGGVGAVLSTALMLSLHKCPCFSAVGVSVAGGAMHNIGQVLCASLILQSWGLVWYLPILLLAGTVSGGMIGMVAELICARSSQRNK